jgi:hypothetical protein
MDAKRSAIGRDMENQSASIRQSFDAERCIVWIKIKSKNQIENARSWPKAVNGYGFSPKFNGVFSAKKSPNRVTSIVDTFSSRSILPPETMRDCASKMQSGVFLVQPIQFARAFDKISTQLFR